MIVTADTNVFVYLFDDRDPGKQSVAAEVVQGLAQRRSLVALQVVGEIRNALQRRLKRPPEQASQQARSVFELFDTFGYDELAVDVALTRSASGQLSYWDAVLVAACESVGIDVLLSEDMRDGAVFAGVEIVNPFAANGLSARARKVLDL